MALEHLLEVVEGALSGRPLALSFGSGHEQALVPLLVVVLLLLTEAVGGTLIGVLVPLCLAFRAIEDCPHRVLAKGVANGNVEELLSSPWAFSP
jgi:hypothetical protein